MAARILVIDDDMYVREMLSDMLRGVGYEVLQAENGEVGLDILEANPLAIDLIITDLMMPETPGDKLLKRLKGHDVLRHTPVIVISGVGDMDNIVRCIEHGASDFLAKPFNLILLQTKVSACIERKRWRDQEEEYRKKIEEYNLHLEERVQQQVKEISEAQNTTIFALSQLAESRDPDTGEHLKRMREYCRIIAVVLSHMDKYRACIDARFIENVYSASPLHDIGKVGVPDHILLKPGKLTDEEFEIMKSHTTIGANTLRSVNQEHPGNQFLQIGIDIAESHHEKWDGSGYPNGLTGEEIPLVGRIVALGDVYDALTSKRCYKDAFDHEKAKSIILAGKGVHFDPDVVEAFLEKEMEFRHVSSSMRSV